MIVLCPECSLNISDLAMFCPHCGYPVKNKNINAFENTKHPKLPSGFGQISKLKNKNLQKPYRVMVSVKPAASCKSHCVPLKPVSYFKTYYDAFAALVEYNKNPEGYVNSYLTFEELFKSWYERQTDISMSMRHRILSAWNYSAGLYTSPVVGLKIKTLRSYIESCKAPLSIKPVMKQLYNQLFDFAIEDDIIDKNPARSFVLNKNIKRQINENKRTHIPFSDIEMNILWQYRLKNQTVDMILVQCYSGWRPTEICELKTENIDFKTGIMIGGIKTRAGKNRIVPIHGKILEIIEHYYDPNKTYLFNNKGKHISYDLYREHFMIIMQGFKFNINHKPHDGRVHFVTSAKKYDMNEYAIKYIVGHNISDLTERIYTRRSIEWLKTEIQKIP